MILATEKAAAKVISLHSDEIGFAVKRRVMQRADAMRRHPSRLSQLSHADSPNDSAEGDTGAEPDRH